MTGLRYVLAIGGVLAAAAITLAGWQPGGAAPAPAAARTAPALAARAAVSPAALPPAVTSQSAPGSLAAPGQPATSAALEAELRRVQAIAECPAAAAACVDLADHLSWLQSDGRISYGPVLMEPGPPGTAHATPAGTFRVQWKAGPDYISNTYFEPMPWAVFFTDTGVAFHGGSLTTPSHGCVHLRIAAARYFHDHLPVGAEVVVF